jgi:uncharacterized membrane protein YphA (DoxX/SURF4 family)
MSNPVAHLELIAGWPIEVRAVLEDPQMPVPEQPRTVAKTDQARERPMNVLLWILQVLLAAVFAAHGWMLIAPPPELLPVINEELGVGFRIFLGTAEITGAIGLILPGMTRVLPWLTPLSAGSLAFVVASATVLHVVRAEISAAATTAVLTLLAAFVAYARWRTHSIAARGGSASSRPTPSFTSGVSRSFDGGEQSHPSHAPPGPPTRSQS